MKKLKIERRNKMAKFRYISAQLVLVPDAGTEGGKKTRKRVTVSEIWEEVSADALWELAETPGKLLGYPVAEVRLHSEEAVEREDDNRDADENGGVPKTADTDMARSIVTKGATAAAIVRGVILSPEVFFFAAGSVPGHDLKNRYVNIEQGLRVFRAAAPGRVYFRALVVRAEADLGPQ